MSKEAKVAALEAKKVAELEAKKPTAGKTAVLGEAAGRRGTQCDLSRRMEAFRLLSRQERDKFNIPAGHEFSFAHATECAKFPLNKWIRDYYGASSRHGRGCGRRSRPSSTALA